MGKDTVALIDRRLSHISKLIREARRLGHPTTPYQTMMDTLLEQRLMYSREADSDGQTDE